MGWYITAAGLVFLLGIGLFAYYIIDTLLNLDDSFIRVSLPGSRVVGLDHPGDYTIFLETGENSDYGPRPGANDLRITIEKPGGGEVSLSRPRGSSTYSFNDRTGRSVAAFNLKRPGKHTITASFVGNQPLQPMALTLTHEFGSKLAYVILTSMGIFFGTILLSGLLVGAGLVWGRRGKKKEPPRMEGLPPPIE